MSSLRIAINLLQFGAMLLDAYTAYCLNTLLAMLLAVLMTVYWLNHDKQAWVAPWMSAAWLLAGADFLLIARPWTPYFASTLLAYAGVSAAMVLLLVGIQRFLNTRLAWGIAVGVVLCHLISGSILLLAEASLELRQVVNSGFWGGLASAGALALWVGRDSSGSRAHLVPAAVLAGHALFHFVRLVLNLLSEIKALSLDPNLMLSLSVSESSLFMVAMFTSLLLADMRRHQLHLERLLHHVKTLTGLIPICSSCKKIRGKGGDWTHLETYLMEHSTAQFSHGICPECSVVLYPEIYGKSGKAPHVCRVTGTRVANLSEKSGNRESEKSRNTE